MNRLEAMTIFLAAIDRGSLSAASRHLGIPLATVSRRISELEAYLKTGLLLRGNRQLVLTETGRTYAASCRRLIEELDEVERIATGEYQSPQGELVISLPQVMGRLHGVPVVTDFLLAYPDISARVQLSDRHINLLEDNVDVALRTGELPDSSLVALRVGAVRQILCASPAYLAVHGTPRTLNDLTEHNCIEYEGQDVGSRWVIQGQTVEVSGRLSVNSIEGAAAAAREGAGIARLLSYQVKDWLDSGALVTVLEGSTLPSVPVHLVYSSRRQVPLKLRVFLDFAVTRLRRRLE